MTAIRRWGEEWTTTNVIGCVTRRKRSAKLEGECCRGVPTFSTSVQVIETFGKEHWMKKHLACINRQLVKLINAMEYRAARCQEVCRRLDAMREGRNVAVHEGTLGRRLARDCVRVSMMVEEPLRREPEMKAVSDHMMETIVHARMWQTLRTIRRTMMETEFTHLPFENEGQWYTVCAEALCVYRDQHRDEGKGV